MTPLDLDPRKSGAARLLVSARALAEVVGRRERQAEIVERSRQQVARSLALLAASSELLAQPFGNALYGPPGGTAGFGPDATRRGPAGDDEAGTNQPDDTARTGERPP